MAYVASINKDYFANQLSIPTLIGSGQFSVAKQTELAAFIAVHEKVALRDILGDDLYTAYQSGLSTSPIPPRITALKAQLVDATAKTSPLANYVWYKWQQTHQQITTAQGDRATVSDNLTTSYATELYVSVWNEMVDALADFYDWLGDNIADYPEYDGTVFNLKYINALGI